MKYNLKPVKGVIQEKRKIDTNGRKIPILILRPEQPMENAPGVLWIHGGGYFLGMKEMVHMGRAENLAARYGAVVVSPGYRLAFQKPYPAAIDDCYDTLLWLKENTSEFDINSDQIMVGGESAGGGLCAALCMMARDKGEVNIAYQMPLYPMLDNFDTETSRDNHNKIWNTSRNHMGWKLYLRKDAGKSVSPYAAAARQTDYTGLPPAYTFCCTDEPFYAETITYIENLRDAGVNADIDIYDGLYHAFDMMEPEAEVSKEATQRFEQHFEWAMEHYFKKQN